MLERKPCPEGVIEWNTGRKYTEEGQYIRATIRDGIAVFCDCSRGIYGQISDCELSRSAIMSAYDANAYEQGSKPWELRSLLGLD